VTWAYLLPMLPGGDGLIASRRLPHSIQYTLSLPLENFPFNNSRQ
jgi:hypothetical protein